MNAHVEAARIMRWKPLAKRPADPLADTLADVRSMNIGELSQHGSSHAPISKPAREIGFAEAEPQRGEEFCGDLRIHGQGRIGIFLEIHQKEKERTLRSFRTLLLDLQEVAESFLVVRLTQPTFDSDATGAIQLPSHMRCTTDLP